MIGDPTRFEVIFDEEDIFIVGYPKSGHTWFRNLVASLIYGVDTENTPYPIIQALVPDVSTTIPLPPYYRRYATPTFFKSHMPPQPGYRRVVYLLRDGRDVLVSYYHYLAAVKRLNTDFLGLIWIPETSTQETS